MPTASLLHSGLRLLPGRSQAALRAWIAAAAERQRTRRALALLDDRALRDVGLTRAQADAEVRRPFWR